MCTSILIHIVEWASESGSLPTIEATLVGTNSVVSGAGNPCYGQARHQSGSYQLNNTTVNATEHLV